ncbi:MAG: hypothetical protein V4629_03155 [Pseudomonadota bacterium]
MSYAKPQCSVAIEKRIKKAIFEDVFNEYFAKIANDDLNIATKYSITVEQVLEVRRQVRRRGRRPGLLIDPVKDVDFEIAQSVAKTIRGAKNLMQIFHCSSMYALYDLYPDVETELVKKYIKWVRLFFSEAIEKEAMIEFFGE